MSDSENAASTRPVGIGSSEADAILHNLRSLRDDIVVAWQERAVILSAAERAALHEEIKATCDLLTDLTRSR